MRAWAETKFPILHARDGHIPILRSGAAPDWGIRALESMHKQEREQHYGRGDLSCGIRRQSGTNLDEARTGLENVLGEEEKLLGRNKLVQGAGGTTNLCEPIPDDELGKEACEGRYA